MHFEMHLGQCTPQMHLAMPLELHLGMHWGTILSSNAFQMHYIHNAFDNNALFPNALWPNAFQMHFKCIEP